MNEISIHMPDGIYKKQVHSNNQKFSCGQRVYVRPINDTSMIHFECDLISRVEYTYSQAYGDCGPCKQYSLEVAAWYEENQLMPISEDCTIEQARDMCKDYFGKSYGEIKSKRNDTINSDPLINSMRYALSKVFIEAIKSSK